MCVASGCSMNSIFSTVNNLAVTVGCAWRGRLEKHPSSAGSPQGEMFSVRN